MFIPLIQTTTTNLRTIPELVDKHFQDGDLQEGFVLIQGCGNTENTIGKNTQNLEKFSKLRTNISEIQKNTIKKNTQNPVKYSKFRKIL